MKRILTLILLVIGGAVVANGVETDDGRSGNSILLDLSAAYTFSVEHSHLLLSTSVTTTNGRYGVGAGLRGYLGLGHGGRYIAPHLRVAWYGLPAPRFEGFEAPDDELSGSVYFGIGPMIVLEEADELSNQSGGVMLLLGTQGPVASFDSGYLSFDGGVELSPPPRFRGAGDTGDAAFDGAVWLWRVFAADALYRWKMSLGLTVTFNF